MWWINKTEKTRKEILSETNYSVESFITIMCKKDNSKYLIPLGYFSPNDLYATYSRLDATDNYLWHIKVKNRKKRKSEKYIVNAIEQYFTHMFRRFEREKNEEIKNTLQK